MIVRPTPACYSTRKSLRRKNLEVSCTYTNLGNGQNPVWTSTCAMRDLATGVQARSEMSCCKIAFKTKNVAAMRVTGSYSPTACCAHTRSKSSTTLPFGVEKFHWVFALSCESLTASSLIANQRLQTCPPTNPISTNITRSCSYNLPKNHKYCLRKLKIHNETPSS